MLAISHSVCGDHGKMDGLFWGKRGFQVFDAISQLAFFFLGYMIDVSSKLHFTEVHHFIVTEDEKVNLLIFCRKRMKICGNGKI